MDEPTSGENTGKSRTNGHAKSSLLNPIVTNSIALIVTVIWAISFIADILMADYKPPGSIHVAFMVILGGVFGLQIVNGRGN